MKPISVIAFAAAVFASGCLGESPPVGVVDGPKRPGNASQEGAADVETGGPAGASNGGGAEIDPRQDHDWPVWRGPHGDGISREAGWTWQWPPSGPPKLWSTNVGTGYSSVSVAAGRLYTMGHRGGNEMVFAYDAQTGEELWKHTYEAELVDNLHEGGPGATPTVEGDRVYAMSRDGQLMAIDAASGRPIWSKRLPDEFGVKMPEWGFTASPIIHGDWIIVDAGRVAAIDKATGDVVWKTGVFRPGYGSAAIFAHAGVPYAAVLNNDALLVVRAGDGVEAARFRWTTQYATSSTTPLVSGDSIFISSGYGQGAALVRFTGDALAEIYQTKEMANHFNNSVLWEGNLYGFDGNSHNARNMAVVAMEHATGRVHWSQRGFGCGSLLISNGKLIILSEDGHLVVAEASPQAYRELARAKVIDGTCWTVPVLSGGRIYCRNDAGDLVCVNLRS